MRVHRQHAAGDGCHPAGDLIAATAARRTGPHALDRFGAGASAAVVDVAMAVIEGAGLRAARNHPYAGGYTIDRHGRPRRQVHAIQIEFDRSLYLDATLDAPTANLEACGRLLSMIASRLSGLFSPGLPIAAE